MLDKMLAVQSESQLCGEFLERLAEELNTADVKLCNWMESKGMNLMGMEDFTRSGCMIYCEPGAAARCVREAIENHEQE